MPRNFMRAVRSAQKATTINMLKIRIGELRDLLGLKAATFSANFKGGFAEIKRQAKKRQRQLAGT